MTIAKRVTFKQVMNTVYGIQKTKEIKGIWVEINGVFEFKVK